jgi:hypothetical protein
MIEKHGQSKNKFCIETGTQIETVIYYVLNTYITYGLLFTYTAREFFVCIENFVRALGAKSRYFPPSSLVISDVRSGTDNTETGQSTVNSLYVW